MKEKIDPVTFLEQAKGSSKPIRVLVAGSRGFTDYNLFSKYISLIVKDFPDVIFVTGECHCGPDNMIIEYCKEFGYLYEGYPAAWHDIGVPGAIIKTKNGRQYNAVAGHQRNQTMAEVSDFFAIFWDVESPGTKDMMKRARYSIQSGFVIIV